MFFSTQRCVEPEGGGTGALTECFAGEEGDEVGEGKYVVRGARGKRKEMRILCSVREIESS